MRLNADTSLVLVIDMQEKLMPAMLGASAQIETVNRLAQCARIMGIPVWATEHVVEKIGATVSPLGEQIHNRLYKTHFDGTRESSFKGWLPKDRPQVLVMGSETHVCVMQTVLGMLEQGVDVWVVEDGCSSRTPADRLAGLARMHAAGAKLITAEMPMFEWVQDSQDTRFRSVISVVKSRQIPQ
jgi:nicotinamidase-related amidase